MTLQTSGAISVADLRDEYKNPSYDPNALVFFSDFYRGGGPIPSGVTVPMYVEDFYYIPSAYEIQLSGSNYWMRWNGQTIYVGTASSYTVFYNSPRYYVYFRGTYMGIRGGYAGNLPTWYIVQRDHANEAVPYDWYTPISLADFYGGRGS